MAIITNDYMKTLLKTVYVSGVANAKKQGSTVLGKIKKDSFERNEVCCSVCKWWQLWC